MGGDSGHKDTTCNTQQQQRAAAAQQAGRQLPYTVPATPATLLQRREMLPLLLVPSVAAAASVVSSTPAWQGPKNGTTVLAHGHFRSAGVVSSAAACEVLCRKDSKCVGWTWQDESHQTCKKGVNPEQQTVCQLVTGGDPEPTACPGHVSGWLGLKPQVPVPNARQLDFMDLELTQFMHFGIPTFWDPPPSYLYGSNPTYHDCHTTSIDHGPQTEGFYPCLKPDVFNPTDLDAENWMEASANMGMKEIIITAHHEGGFAL
eukprot:COSAG01_NODE_17886_length_1116_cov_10.194690_1_plen_259_part_10